MSLPNYLAKIKSAGIYRFVWDKSEVPPQMAETLRLVVGYSEKGPFNTPVYLESVQEFKEIYGGISKRLEKKGIYFHRLAMQALEYGPILALNIKPFNDETVSFINFNASEINRVDELTNPSEVHTASLTSVYDTNRFWSIDPDHFVNRLPAGQNKEYISIASTDTKDNSCSIFIRKFVPTSYKGITIRNWYASQNLEMPEYYEPIQDTDLSDYFMEIYVFRGEFTAPLYEREMNEDGTTVKTYVGPLSKYLATDGNSCMIDMNYKNSFGEDDDALEAMSTDSNSHFVGSYSGITLPNFKDANGNYISIDLKFNGDNNLHKMIMELNESVLDEKYDPEDIENAKSSLIECLSVDSISADTDPEFEADSKLRPIYLPGYVYKTIEKTAGADDIYRSCMAQLSTKGIRTALTNRVDVEYHYIVDTFDTPVVPEFAMGYKKELIGIAKEKDNAFAILNFPKMTEFTSNSACKSEVTGVFDIEKITEVFSLPSEVEGASYGAYYTQLMFSDGTVKSVIPSAALVSNLFMEKWGPRQPYYIVAGPNYGRISYSGLVGPDYNFGRSDLDVLEPMGVNAIIYVPRKGTYINSNQTAKQAPVSGLSKVHIRELVIYLQNEIEYLLQSYQWELNTQALRDLIKAKADVICETIKNNGGLYAYINVCDETNNTPEIIDNEMIVLNTEIEPARGAGKMVHQLTIHKTGALSSKIQ